jgi:hypothetical protein
VPPTPSAKSGQWEVSGPQPSLEEAPSLGGEGGSPLPLPVALRSHEPQTKCFSAYPAPSRPPGGSRPGSEPWGPSYLLFSQRERLLLQLDLPVPRPVPKWLPCSQSVAPTPYRPPKSQLPSVLAEPPGYPHLTLSLSCGGLRPQGLSAAHYGKGKGLFCRGPRMSASPQHPRPGPGAPQLRMGRKGAGGDVGSASLGPL